MTKLKYLLILAALALSACAGRQEEVAIHGEADVAGHRIGTLAGSCYDIQLSPRKDIKLCDAVLDRSLLIEEKNRVLHEQKQQSAARVQQKTKSDRKYSR